MVIGHHKPFANWAYHHPSESIRVLSPAAAASGSGVGSPNASGPGNAVVETGAVVFSIATGGHNGYSVERRVEEKDFFKWWGTQWNLGSSVRSELFALYAASLS